MRYGGNDTNSVLNMEMRGSFIAWFLGHVREGTRPNHAHDIALYFVIFMGEFR